MATCGECGGRGVLTRLGGDWGATAETEVPCWACSPPAPAPAVDQSCPQCIAEQDSAPTDDAPPAKSWPVYVNAYEVGQCYGGREEGGWWYDSGEPLASIPCMDAEQIAAARAHLQAVFGPTYEGARDRTSVIGEPNLEIYEEEHTAKFFPETRPHYE